MIEFNPFQATQTRWSRAESTLDSYITMLATDEELLALAMDDPTRGVLLFNIKYLRNNISAEMLSSYFAGEWFPPRRKERLAEPEDLTAKRNELSKELRVLFKQDYPDYKDQAWHYGWQGGGTIPQERSARTLEAFAEYYATFQNPQSKENYRQCRIFSADIEQLNFSPILIEHFINIVENFKQFSDHVEIIMLPRSSDIIVYSPEAQVRLAQSIKQIELATGLQIKNHQLIPQIKPHMYSDVTHLTRYEGATLYTQYLYEQFADLL